jgi:hypothetical protein
MQLNYGRFRTQALQAYMSAGAGNTRTGGRLLRQSRRDLNLGAPDALDITPWADRVQLIDAKYVGPWELPALGPVTAPTAVLIRPDGYVAWVGDGTQLGLADALATWFGPPAAIWRAAAKAAPGRSGRSTTSASRPTSGHLARRPGLI